MTNKGFSLFASIAHGDEYKARQD